MTLNTLRQRGGVILAIAIGGALLAFVLGDLLTSGDTLFNSAKMRAGEIDGHKVSIQDYQSQVDYYTNVYKISSGSDVLNDEQTESVRSQAWDYFVRKDAVMPALENLGVIVTEAEMLDMVNGKYISPMLMGMFTDPETGTYNKQAVQNFISRLDEDQSGQIRFFWDYLKREMKDQRAIVKFKALVDKAVYVTDFEAKQYADILKNNYNLNFVAVTYDKIADSLVAVKQADLKSYYDQNKNMFKRQDSRSIEYVVFEALPSTEDYAAAEKYITELASEFKTADNILQFASLNSQSRVDNRYYKEGELPTDLNAYAFSKGDSIYGPIKNGDSYTLARISDVRSLPDSVSASHIMLPLGQDVLADSLLQAVKGGSDFALVASQYSQDQASARMGGDLGMFDPQVMVPAFAEACYTTPKGGIVKVDTQYGIHIIKIGDKKDNVSKVQLATITYEIEPSEATINRTYNDANKFAKDAGKTLESFRATASKDGLAVRPAYVGQNDRMVQGIPQSREIIRWAYEAPVGSVSDVKQFGYQYVISSVASVSEKGLAPFADVENDIRRIVIMQKKGDMLASKMGSASSLDQIAAEYNTAVNPAEGVNFQTYIVPEVGYDIAFAGGVCGASAGKLSKPIIGGAGVYAVNITADVVNENVTAESEKVRITAEEESRAFMSAYQALMELSNIKDTRYKFY